MKEPFVVFDHWQAPALFVSPVIRRPRSPFNGRRCCLKTKGDRRRRRRRCIHDASVGEACIEIDDRVFCTGSQAETS
jgi:hypothetical protein